MAHLPKWTIERTNRFIIQVIHEKKITWPDFFSLDQGAWKEIFPFSESELRDLEQAKGDIPRLSFIAEQLQNEGFHIIPINSPEYPPVLKENLKVKNAPPVLYTKGRKGLLQEDAVAIVGSRKAGEKALAFTDHVARKCVREMKVVVSGFAKGVDTQALNSTLNAHGKSIIVLPQGILTFQSGFKKYYEPIVNGDVLVLSSFFPKAGWDVGLAMARNAYIYGLAGEIYIAESDSKGGTWEGAMDGLKRGRSIYVRHPESDEHNANLKLIGLGAIPVDMNGEVLHSAKKENIASPVSVTADTVQDSASAYNKGESLTAKSILDFLSGGAFTAKEIILALRLEMDAAKLTSFLKKNPDVKTIPGKPVKFTRNEASGPSLFD